MSFYCLSVAVLPVSSRAAAPGSWGCEIAMKKSQKWLCMAAWKVGLREQWGNLKSGFA